MPQQMNLYISELQMKLQASLSSQRGDIQVWGDYWINCLDSRISVKNASFGEVMGKMKLSQNQHTLFFSQLLTTPGFERQGIGSLVVTLGILCALIRELKFLRLGEPDTNSQKKGHFWTNLHLSEVNQTPISLALKAMLASQQLLAKKLGVTVDPNALLVAFKPKKKSTGSSKKVYSKDW